MKNTRLVAITSALVALVITTPTMAQPSTLIQLFPALVGVELKAAQQNSLEQLSQQTLPEIRRALSPQQVRQFDLALRQGKSVRVALLSLDLSMSQKLNLNRKLKSIRAQIDRILTPAQQQQVTSNAISIRQKQSANSD